MGSSIADASTWIWSSGASKEDVQSRYLRTNFTSKISLGHKAKTLKFYQYQLAFQREKYDEAKIELDKAMKANRFIYVVFTA